ncbi:Membrane protein [Rhodovastum atsumiense]|uniref:DASS family sodium-coupled anion symporter n=1 Tax=Rhodovastum atsumiense TaxID=504468 RepID=A0A5M6IL96_9PROT|nr:DASS family sodium-coupled anion symporter [Rhodovastum atsumiense]KAA5608395.1 DASS family sodium-coupled anion symporter [Rhodovastum atsumiense]CAH2599956.1 Membrane protein [Rhodovastum atsumiense]
MTSVTTTTFDRDGLTIAKVIGLSAGILGLVAVLLLPLPAGLPSAGLSMMAIMLFAVIIWMTEAVPYAVSAALIIALIAFILGLGPDLAQPKTLMGTTKALGMALSGFSNTAFALVAGAMFISAAMMITRLDKRIALLVLSRVGGKTRRILAGVIFVGFILSFFVPSTTARVSCIVPIVLGIITAFNVDRKSRFAAVLMIATAQADSLWNVGIKTAAAQNMIAVGFIEKQLGYSISWLEWFIAAAPFSALMSVVLYYVLLKMIPPEIDEIAGGRETIARELRQMGPVTTPEWRLLIISCVLLFLWTTEKQLHNFDTSTTTLAAIALMLMPGIGVMNWKDAQVRIGWGTIVLFGVGISLGECLLRTKAADWMANSIVATFGLQEMTALAIIAVLTLFLIIVHLGFASATGLSAAMIPIVIAVLQSIRTPGINVIGLTMIAQFVISFGFILPVNAPQNMVAYSTETFTARDFIRTGIPLTICAYLGILLMSMTYWRWLGLTG